MEEPIMSWIQVKPRYGNKYVCFAERSGAEMQKAALFSLSYVPNINCLFRYRNLTRPTTIRVLFTIMIDLHMMHDRRYQTEKFESMETGFHSTPGRPVQNSFIHDQIQSGHERQCISGVSCSGIFFKQKK
jgi:hypothetical protein